MLSENDRNRFYAIIMAGGGGTRLWPWSRKGQTKQMLRIVGDRSMFQITIDRLRDLISTDNMLVITTAEQAEKLETQADEICHENYILEPMPKGTASVVGMAAIQLLARNKDAVMAILTADHYIRDVKYFRSLLESAYMEAEKGHLVTLGIEPTFPSTGMGYIEQGELLETAGTNPVHKVSRFCEKPDHDTAVKFLESGKYSWNSGMFIWRADRILAEIEKDLPDLYGKLMEIYPTIGTPDYEAKVAEVWPTIQAQTIDYGVMEKADNVYVLPSSFGWDDVGSWLAVGRINPGNDMGNVIKGDIVSVNTSRCIVQGGKKMIAMVGMEDTIVVDTDDALLVCAKDSAGEIKKVLEVLKAVNRQELL